MAKNTKLHRHLVTFKHQHGSVWVYMGTPTRNFNLPTIAEAVAYVKKLYGLKDVCILSVSYLGKMTQEEFDGPNKGTQDHEC